MTIAEHADKFAGRPVQDYDPKIGIVLPEGTTYRLRTDYDATEPFTDLLARFLEDPAAGRVAGLVIGYWQGDDSSESSAPIVEALVAARGRLVGLRALFLGDIIGEENEISWIEQSDVTPLFDAYPELREFRVRGGTGLVFGRLRHANLRSLIVETGGLGGEVVRAIAASDLPRLEHLELWLGTDDYGGTTTIADLGPILAGDQFPALRRLGLRNCEGTDAIAEALVDAPILGRIEVLDLSMGDLGDEGARALAGIAALRRLRSLDIHHHFVSDEALGELLALGIAVEADDRMEPYDWDDEARRYIAVTE